MAAASVEEAFAYCEARTKAHYENFPVGLFVPAREAPLRLRALRLRPRRRRLRGRADLRGRAPGEARPVGGAPRRRLPRRGRGADLRGPGRDRAPARTSRRQLLLDLLSAFRQDTEKNRYAELGGAPRLLPALGEPGGPAGAPRLRASDDPELLAALRRDLHRAPARQPLAGRGDRLRPRPHLRARGPDAPSRGRHLGLQHRAGQRRLARAHGRAHRPDPGAVRGGAPAVRPGGPRAALRDAAHLAGRDVDPRPHRGGRGRRLPAAPEALGRSTRRRSPGAPGAGPRA